MLDETDVVSSSYVLVSFSHYSVRESMYPHIKQLLSVRRKQTKK